MNATPSVLPVLYSEPPALDLVNTRIVLSGEWVDLLDDRAARTEWLTHEVGRLDVRAQDAERFTTDAAEALKALRGPVSEAVEAARHERRPPKRSLAALNDAARGAPATRQARWEDGAVLAGSRREGPQEVRLAASFAEAAVELITGPDITKVRLCEAPACVVRFLARNARRRWCTPDICGNRARVARYYVRHKQD